MKTNLRVLSLGAGVQSSTLALMIEKGEIPMVEAAIFADTGGGTGGRIQMVGLAGKTIILSCATSQPRKFKN